MKRTFGNQRGIATAAVIAMSLVLTTIAFFILKASEGHNQEPTEDLLYATSVEIIKASLYAVASHPRAWMHTVNNNTGAANLDCVRLSTLCTNAFRVVNLYSPTGALFYNSVTALAASATNQGFTTKGVPCNTFHPTSVPLSQGCVIRVTIWWKPFCAASCYVSPPNTAPPYASTGNIPKFERGFFYVYFTSPTGGYSFKGVNSISNGILAP
jgi:hypothetical protein